MDDGGITEPAMNPGAWTNSPLAHRNASRGCEDALHMTTNYGQRAGVAEAKNDCESVPDVRAKRRHFALARLI
jgi:hypothetical protein